MAQWVYLVVAAAVLAIPPQLTNTNILAMQLQVALLSEQRALG
jgi:hypothetical protein